MNEGATVDFSFSRGRDGKTDIRDMESWSVSESATDPVNEAGFPPSERNSPISSRPTLEEKVLSKLFFWWLF